MTIRSEVSKGIWSELLQDSISPHGNRLTSLLNHYPLFVHAQVLKHRLVSVSAASARAIPSQKLIEYAKEDPALPAFIGVNKPGMQSVDEVDEETERYLLSCWKDALNDQIRHVNEFSSAKAHKEVTNRLLSPFMNVLDISSATQWNNAFHLRIHDDAQRETRYRFENIYLCREESKPMLIEHGEWHTPYVNRDRNALGELRYYDISGVELDLKTAKSVSAASCAQVSYRKLDQSVEKAQKIHDMLVKGDLLHGGALEHCATPMSDKEYARRLQAAELIEDEIALFKGNLRGWIQYRKEFANENLTKEFVL